MTMTNVPEIYNLPERKLCQEDRCVTDKHGFAILIIALMYSFGLPALIGLLTRDLSLNEINTRTSTANNDSSINDMRDDMYSNSSGEAAYDALVSAIKAVTNDNPLTHSFICNAVIGLLVAILPTGIFFFIFKNFWIGLADLYTSFMTDYSHHFTIVSAGKMIITSIFLMVMHFRWIDAPLPQYRYITCLETIELFLLCLNVAFFFLTKSKRVDDQDKSFKSTLRYYMSNRNVILFQFFNFIIASLLIAYAGLYLYTFSPIYLVFTQMGFCLIICLLHNYAKMVIILARASHNWEQGEETISIKTVLLSMMTIIRFHIGSAVLHMPIVRFCWGMFYTYLDVLRQYSKTRRRVYINSHAAHTMTHLMMFSAIYGQATSKAAKSLHYFEKKNQVVTEFENKMSTVWVDVLTVSLPFLVWNIFWELLKSTAEELFALIPILTSSFALIGAYFYVVVSTMNTVENTIEFCSMIKKEDIEEMYDEEQSNITEVPKEIITTTGAEKANEKQDSEPAVKEKKIEISENGSIVLKLT